MAVPARPSDLRVVGTAADSVGLAWTDNASHETGYAVKFSDGSGWQEVDNIPANSLDFEITDLQRNTAYEFYVGARNATGTNWSTRSVSATTAAYEIGDSGPAGGVVFYDKGDDSGGWRYLEAAPASSQPPGEIAWGPSEASIPGAGEVAVGTGKQNTAAIMTIEGSGTLYAAQICDALECGGFADWFLPSKGELALMVRNLSYGGLGGFGSRLYWSSSWSDTGTAWSQWFYNGHQSEGNCEKKYLVRAIRAF